MPCAWSAYADNTRSSAAGTVSPSRKTPLGICQKRPPLKWRSALSSEVWRRRYSTPVACRRNVQTSNTRGFKSIHEEVACWRLTDVPAPDRLRTRVLRHLSCSDELQRECAALVAARGPLTPGSGSQRHARETKCTPGVHAHLLPTCGLLQRLSGRQRQPADFVIARVLARKTADLPELRDGGRETYHTQETEVAEPQQGARACKRASRNERDKGAEDAGTSQNEISNSEWTSKPEQSHAVHCASKAGNGI